MKLSNYIFSFGILLMWIPLDGMEFFDFKTFMAITLQVDADNFSSDNLIIKALSTRSSHILKPETTANIFEISIPLALSNNNKDSYFERLELTHVGTRKYLINLSKESYAKNLCAELVGLYSTKPAAQINTDSIPANIKSKLVFTMDGEGNIDCVYFLSIE